MLEFLETGKALYVLATVCALGLLGRLVARNLYKRLLKETDNMTLTKNRYLRELKQKTENAFRLNQGIRSSRVYLEKQLAGYRFLGISLSGWGSFGGQMTILCFLLGGLAAFGAYWYRCDSYYIVLYGTVGILTGLVTMVADYWANLSERKQQLLNALEDYMENSLFNRLAREMAAISVEDIRRENGKTATAGSGRDKLSSQERRNRTDKVIRAVINPAEENGENKDGRKEKMDRKDREGEDRDFTAQDLESLSQEEYKSPEESAEAGKERRRSQGGRGSRFESGFLGRSQKRNGWLQEMDSASEETRESGPGRRDAEYLKTSLEQIAAGRERNQPEGEWIKELSPDELELVGQILKQYLT